MALSTEQQKLRNLSQELNGSVNTVRVRRISSKYDQDRVTELWANLTMIQQMQGNPFWLNESQKSNLSWNEYVSKLVKSRGSRVIVIENDEEIFGFAYMRLEHMNMNNAKAQTNLKAVIKELYFEPAYKKIAKKTTTAKAIQETIMDMGIDYVEFDVDELE